jgi:RHS repeat-associated protein
LVRCRWGVAGLLLQPWRYAGYYHDSDTGLYYLQQRYYSPTLGRFLSKEPMFSDFCTDCGFQALLDNAPTTSPYAYAANRPLVPVDPDGRSWKSAAKWAGVVGAVGCIVATAGACAALLRLLRSALARSTTLDSTGRAI